MHMGVSDFEVQVSQIKLKRVRLDPLNGRDADVSNIRIFRDNGDGVLNMDSAGEPIRSIDAEVSSGTFSGSLATLNFSEEGRPYALVSKLQSPATFFVTLDIDPTAVFSHTGADNLNETIGLELDGQSNFCFFIGSNYSRWSIFLLQGGCISADLYS